MICIRCNRSTIDTRPITNSTITSIEIVRGRLAKEKISILFAICLLVRSRLDDEVKKQCHTSCICRIRLSMYLEKNNEFIMKFELYVWSGLFIRVNTISENDIYVCKLSFRNGWSSQKYKKLDDSLNIRKIEQTSNDCTITL